MVSLRFSPGSLDLMATKNVLFLMGTSHMKLATSVA